MIVRNIVSMIVFSVLLVSLMNPKLILLPETSVDMLKIKQKIMRTIVVLRGPFQSDGSAYSRTVLDIGLLNPSSSDYIT